MPVGFSSDTGVGEVAPLEGGFAMRDCRRHVLRAAARDWRVQGRGRRGAGDRGHPGRSGQ
eukprot:5295481-Pyramimonas_sp.AAC.1